MHLKSIILDGFKSYGQRTEITGFDPEFNAITGLNGSGKSNILDAICFVLGITNLSHVRAGSMQELVYKNGQAGVTKANVSITFDNRDPATCPLGYESHSEITVTRQVVIGGKNKYLLNGVNVQNKRIQDLFCSVQMNVNNPHFLIMQGRITKVLNMKPQEILSMIEEAAGTRMYEAKRQVAQKTIEKKDAKLAQLNDVVDEEIRPKLRKLREEKGQYLEYQKTKRELDATTRLFVAFQFVRMTETSTLNQNSLRRIQGQVKTSRTCIENDRKEAVEVERRLVEGYQKRDDEIGGVVEQLDAELKVNMNREAKVVAVLKATVESIASETKKKAQLEKSVAEDEAALAAKQAIQARAGDTFALLQAADAAGAEAEAAAQEKFQAVSAGLLASADGAQETLQAQLMNVRQRSAEALADVKQAELQLKHSTTELKTKERDLKASAADAEKDTRLLATAEREVAKLREQLDRLDYTEGTNEELTASRNRLAAQIQALQVEADRIEARNPRLAFDYADPTPNFNRSAVRGLVCNLFKVKDPATSVALETAAGGRLYNVIVDTETVGKMILERGRLTNRVNIIPLNKISAKGLDTQTQQLAAELVGKENARSALSLIEYAPDVHNAMVYVFGQTFVCTDMTTASTVTFNRNIRKKCVTLDGDSTDPGGTMSGGAPVRGTPVLQMVTQLREIKDRLAAATRELADVEKRLAGIAAVAAKHATAKEAFELRSHELEVLQNRLRQTEHHQRREQVDGIKALIAELNEKVASCKKIAAESEKRGAELESKMGNAKEIQERELREAKEALAKAKKAAALAKNKWREREQEYETLRLEMSELTASIEQGRKSIAAAETALEELEVERQQRQAEVDVVKAEVKVSQDKVKEKKDIISQQTKELTQLLIRKEKLLKSVGDSELDVKKAEMDSAKLEAEEKDSVRKLAALKERYEWVETEKQYFGVTTAYDFRAQDMAAVSQRLAELKDKKDRLEKTVNTRAMNMLEQQEEECGDLISKKQIVENDKFKIMEVIRELDEKKKIALRIACEQVNKDFGSIFSTLLPGAQAKLQPPEGKDVLDGLEVKVGFSNVWKDSLGELSGGQRSLVALSLILAMLLFKPAPIYILDEVDAALDLSHTQNIGNMLKTHFKNSQFIIVSLKDGMFNNANVLFRTAFVDGMSTVGRSVQRQSSSHRRH